MQAAEDHGPAEDEQGPGNDGGGFACGEEHGPLGCGRGGVVLRVNVVEEGPEGGFEIQPEAKQGPEERRAVAAGQHHGMAPGNDPDEVRATEGARQHDLGEVLKAQAKLLIGLGGFIIGGKAEEQPPGLHLADAGLDLPPHTLRAGGLQHHGGAAVQQAEHGVLPGVVGDVHALCPARGEPFAGLADGDKGALPAEEGGELLLGGVRGGAEDELEQAWRIQIGNGAEDFQQTPHAQAEDLGGEGVGIEIVFAVIAEGPQVNSGRAGVSLLLGGGAAQAEAVAEVEQHGAGETENEGDHAAMHAAVHGIGAAAEEPFADLHGVVVGAEKEADAGDLEQEPEAWQAHGLMRHRALHAAGGDECLPEEHQAVHGHEAAMHHEHGAEGELLAGLILLLPAKAYADQPHQQEKAGPEDGPEFPDRWRRGQICRSDCALQP